ncbi:MAG: biotin--[acetyl-CoA-carboxylase] ligase [Pirellulales bacterium]|nr:biotin--[acetyl-CoA-carboxylase] ligase [Pirellulales bacterium]
MAEPNRCVTSVGSVETPGRRAAEGLLADQICRSAIHLASATSTNSLALEDLRAGAIPTEMVPRLYLADSQTAGRGRHGRTWVSNAGTLTFSLLVDWPADAVYFRLLPLAVGVGVARAIEFAYAPLRSRLKWPNDVYIDGGKVAGVLIESAPSNQDRIVIGVGVNVHDAPLLDDPNAPPVRSISQVIGRAIDRYQLLGTLVGQIVESMNLAQSQAEEILGEFRQRCLLTGSQVSFSSRETRQDGLCVGVNDLGQLTVQTTTGTTHLESGEANLLRSGQ